MKKVFCLNYCSGEETVSTEGFYQHLEKEGSQAAVLQPQVSKGNPDKVDSNG